MARSLTLSGLTRGLRWFLGIAGMVMVSVSIFGIIDSSEPMMLGGMGIFMASTNFCRQCPLLSAVIRMVGRKGPSVPVDRIR